MISGRVFLFSLLLLVAFCSCTMQRRLYRPGFYVSGAEHAAAEVRRDAETHRMRPEGKIKPTVLPKVERPEFDIPEKVSITVCATAHKVREVDQSGLRMVSRPKKILLARREQALYDGVIPNHVAQAAFRMMLISFGLLCAAFLVYASFPELVYVTFIILIATLVYALVSLITSVHARRDKIANDKTWLRLALLALVMTILIICLAGLLFILLL